MAHIPQAVLEKRLLIPGLGLRGRGKVRDSFDIPGHPDKMLPVATNSCSIFDFILNTWIPFKGQILTALSCFWVDKVVSPVCETDLVAYGAAIDQYLPESLRGNPELQKHATVVKLLPQPDFEDIVRLYLTGSGWTSYQKDGTVCGHKLPPGLIDGSKLPYPLYTPTTKAAVGHDEHVSADSVADRLGVHRERLSLQVAGAISAYAETCGVILADTKFEFSGRVIADEKGTPDSSRFWDANAWKKAHAKGKLPPSFDKQFVREWGKKAFIEKDETGRKRDPENPDDLVYVSSQVVPDDVVKTTTQLYRYIFWRLTGMQIEDYQFTKMGIDISRLNRKIEVIVGSASDLPQTELGLASLLGIADASVNVISCHRNPEELRRFALGKLIHADVVVAGAGMAAALPGIVKSELCMLGHSEIPVIGVAFNSQTEKDNKAATLSIECLPGQPVELDKNGNAYFGQEGFLEACKAAVHHEFLPKTIEAKPAQIGIRQKAQGSS